MIARSHNAVMAAAALALSIPLASACGSKGQSGFVPSGDDAGAAEGGDDGPGGGGSGGGTSSGINLGGGSGSSGAGLGTGTCKDGTYSGTFQCSFIFGDAGATDASVDVDGGGFVVTGTISFQLMHDMSSGESFIDTASGSFSGNCCLNLFSITANVGGMLNCNSGAFDGMLSNGMYTGFFMTGSFDGPLAADYNGTTFAFVNGTWNLAVPNEGNCVGTWSASYTDQ